MEREIVLRVPTIDFDFPWWYYLITWCVLAWLIIGPFFCRYYFKCWTDTRLTKEQYDNYQVGTVAMWVFSPIVALLLVPCWLLYYVFTPFHPVMCRMLFGKCDGKNHY